MQKGSAKEFPTTVAKTSNKRYFARILGFTYEYIWNLEDNFFLSEFHSYFDLY